MRTRLALTVIALAAAAVPLSQPETALAPVEITTQAGPAAAVAPAASTRTRTTCSGTLGPWQGWTHGTFGDLTAVDGDPQADVVIAGDSITTGGRDELASWLAARGKTLAGSYWSGRPTHYAVDWALSLTTKPKILVMASGTNDIFDPSVMTAEVARLRAGLPTTRIIWVDVQAARSATALCDQRNSMWVNSQIRTGMAGAEVCGWSIGFADQPNRLTYYLSDGIHPKEGVGTNYWAAVVGQCIY